MLQKEIKNYIQNYRYNDLLKEGTFFRVSNIPNFVWFNRKNPKTLAFQTFDREGKKETTNFSRVNQQTTPFHPLSRNHNPPIKSTMRQYLQRGWRVAGTMNSLQTWRLGAWVFMLIRSRRWG